MADQDADLSEEATQHKLDEARKKGSVAKSQDFTAAIVLAATVGALYASGWDAMRQSVKLQQSILAHATQLDWGADGVSAWIGQVALGMLHILAPLFMTVAIAAILVNLFQTGPVFTMHPLSPDIERINPVAGFKKIFSLRTLYEAVKSIFKLIILGLVGYFAIFDAIPGLVGLTGKDPKAYAKLLIDLTGSVMVKLIFTLFVIAVIDFTYTRWEFAKRMRMSKRDVRDESKNREGDPRIRSRIRELRQEMLKRSKAMRNVPNADVLITNPTRIAVALSYKHGEVGAPQLIAKGAGGLAKQMRAIAYQHHIPVVQNKLLARALFREVDYDGYVPEKLYAQVAKIMVWVYTMRDAKNNRKGAR